MLLKVKLCKPLLLALHLHSLQVLLNLRSLLPHSLRRDLCLGPTAVQMYQHAFPAVLSGLEVGVLRAGVCHVDGGRGEGADSHAGG